MIPRVSLFASSSKVSRPSHVDHRLSRWSSHRQDARRNQSYLLRRKRRSLSFENDDREQQHRLRRWQWISDCSVFDVVANRRIDRMNVNLHLHNNDKRGHSFHSCSQWCEREFQRSDFHPTYFGFFFFSLSSEISVYKPMCRPILSSFVVEDRNIHQALWQLPVESRNSKVSGNTSMANVSTITWRKSWVSDEEWRSNVVWFHCRASVLRFVNPRNWSNRNWSSPETGINGRWRPNPRWNPRRTISRPARSSTKRVSMVKLSKSGESSLSLWLMFFFL